MKDVRRLQDSGWKLDGVLEGRVEGVDHRRPPVPHPVRLVHLKPWFSQGLCQCAILNGFGSISISKFISQIVIQRSMQTQIENNWE